ncbi:putative RNA recognition motif domain, nucleotide-binding alpha-beta plait domain superfamily [Helianthus anomalus]
MAARVTKFYVANIPDGCRPWDLASFLGNYGEIAGSFIAKKRSKEGLKFGFVSFRGGGSGLESYGKESAGP